MANHIMNLTDNQWYNLIAGFQSALRLKNIGAQKVDTNIILKPIGVNGSGKIGIEIPNIKYTTNPLNISIPIYTHDVDIAYSGFSTRIQLDILRVVFLSISEADFGAIGTNITYTYSNGLLNVYGLVDGLLADLESVADGLATKPTEFNVPIILFYLNITIASEVTPSTPIYLDLLSSTGYDKEYTTLQKFELVADDNKYHLYYITPTINNGGKITSDLSPTVTPIGDEKQINVTQDKSGIYIGKAITPPGTHGVVPIVVNSNTTDNFHFNGIHLNVTVEDNSIIFIYINIVGVDGWTLAVGTTTNEDGFLVLDITGSRSNSDIGSMTVGYIEYEIAEEYESYVIPLNNILSELIS